MRAIRYLLDLEEMSSSIAEIEGDSEGVPVLLRQYLKIGGELLAFNVDKGFSDVLDGLVLVDLRKTDPARLETYMVLLAEPVVPLPGAHKDPSLAFAVAPPESAEYYASRNASLDSGEVMLTYRRNRLMNAYSRIGVGLGMLASAALGGLTVEQVHAQAKPPVYFVGEIDVSNPEGYAKDYLPKAREIIKAHGGRLLGAGGAAGSGAQVIAIDGEPPTRVVIYQYPSVDAVRAWRNDPAYEQVRKIGEKYAKYRTFAVEGVPQ